LAHAISPGREVQLLVVAAATSVINPRPTIWALVATAILCGENSYKACV
jgi:hypothetical protein